MANLKYGNILHVNLENSQVVCGARTSVLCLTGHYVKPPDHRGLFGHNTLMKHLLLKAFFYDVLN